MRQAANRRYRASRRLVERIAPEGEQDLTYLAMLHCRALDDVKSRGGPASLEERRSFAERARSELRELRRAIELGGCDVAEWLERYWWPVVPTRELRIVATWGPHEAEDLPDVAHLPVTASARFWAGTILGHEGLTDELVDLEIHTEMRRMAMEFVRAESRARGGQQPKTSVEEVWELRTRGVGWHHGGE